MSLPSGKRVDLIVRSQEPFNAGPTPAQLSAEAITPNDAFFVRNHGAVPSVDAADYRLNVEGMVAQPLQLSLSDLVALPAHTVTATLQCAGNRRRELVEVAPIPGEVEWDTEAISTAVWRGARLRDVLTAAGVEPGAVHVAFAGLDQIDKNGSIIHFGGSIPLDKALDPDTLLAYEMNGVSLPPTHGFPVRVVVPGYIGARSVKWLASIVVQAEPSANYYQARAYRLFPAHVDATTADWSSAVMLGELPVNCVIASPEWKASVSAGEVVVRGYALTTGRAVARVEVSADDGQTWQVAQLSAESSRWAWRWWESRFELAGGTHILVARVWDSAANTQPERVATVWNFKGYMNNAWHRVQIQVT